MRVGKRVEREVAFTVRSSWEVPDLSTVVPDGGSVETMTAQLEARYFDTADSTLQRLGVTLRRRTGGDDPGWHLNIPTAGQAQSEIRSGARRTTVPESLLRRIGGVIAAQPLAEVAMISTERQVHRVVDGSCVVVVEVADDTMTGRASAPGGEQGRWREVEAELGPAGSEKVLARVTKLFARTGARRADVQRKLDQVVKIDRPSVGRKVSKVVGAYVQEQCAAILLGDIALREEVDPESVHRMRVAVRRLRSTLRNFGRLFDVTASPSSAGRIDNGSTSPVEATLSQVDSDLQWLAGLLGPIRDGDILARRLTSELADLPAEQVLGPVERLIFEELAAERSTAIQAWQHSWTGEQYRRIMTTLTGWLAEVPLDRRAKINAERVLTTADRKLRRRMAGASDPVDLHRARKAAKRLRYTANLLTSHTPDAKKVAKKAKRVQTLLGEHQDLVVEADFLRRLGALAATCDGHNGFTYGVLMARADIKATTIRTQATHRHH